MPVIERAQQPDDALQVARRIEEVLSEPFRLSDFEVRVDCAIGCAISNDVEGEDEDLVRHAQFALRRAKESGQVEVYRNFAFTEARRRFSIESVADSKPGTLYILGSLTAGTIWETEPRYATKMDYDKRFEYLRPASFPMTRRYEVDSWDQDWEEVESPGKPGLRDYARKPSALPP